MRRRLSERINCVCLKSVKIDEVILVDKLEDRFDFRTRREHAYCRDCPEGQRKASAWLAGMVVIGNKDSERKYEER